jgi:CspA family cold shock protein
LAGKTKSQILSLLFADVKSVVEDKQTQDSIWTSWASAGTSEDESVAEGPPAPAPAAAPPPPPAKAPAVVIDEGTCSPRKASLLVQPNQAERLGLVRVGYRLWFATGTVICFNEAKGYGYIAPDDGGEALFVHFTSINRDGPKTLKEGAKVQYEIQTTPKGQRVAVNVQSRN